MTSSSHHHHHHHSQHHQQQHYAAPSIVGNKINDSNNNKHGSENNNNNSNKSTNKLNDIKVESKSFKAYKDVKVGGQKSNNQDDTDADKLIKNDTNNNNHPDNKNSKMQPDLSRLILSSPTSAAAALSPYHHQSYLSQYKNHINYSDQAALQQQQQQHQQQMQHEEMTEANKYNNFAATTAEYDPYQNNPIYYHPTTHFAHSTGSAVAASPTTFYVTNPEYYHQSYAMGTTGVANAVSSGAATATIVQPMVTKIDAVIGATLHHPGQNLMAADAYGAPEQMKDDDFSNILAGVRKTCYSN